MPRKKTQQEFVQQSSTLHDNKYDYSLVEYINNKTPVKIICPEHGEFRLRPDSHLFQQQGCRQCGYQRNSENFSSTTEEFIKKAQLIHGNKYDYSKTIYVRSFEKVTVTCPKHGDYDVLPCEHLRGVLCKKCVDESKRDTFKEFTLKAFKIHRDLYFYEKENFTNSKTKINVTCKACLLTFRATPNSILRGRGCPSCNKFGGYTKTGFLKLCQKKQCKAILYVLFCKENDEKFFKIGITTRSVQDRYPSKTHLPYKYKTLFKLERDPDTVYDSEKQLMRLLKNYKYQPKISFGGSIKECFTVSKETYKLIKECLHGI